MERWVFRMLALLWLPAGLAATSMVRFPPPGGPSPEPWMWLSVMLISAVKLLAMAPCGLPLALGCRGVWRLGHRRAAWAAGLVLGVVTVEAVLLAGLHGLLAIAACALGAGLPVWAAWWWLARRS